MALTLLSRKGRVSIATTFSAACGFAALAWACAFTITTAPAAEARLLHTQHAQPAHASHGRVAVNVNVGAGYGARRHYRPNYYGYGYRNYNGAGYGNNHWNSYWNGYYRPGIYAGLFVPLLPFGYTTLWQGRDTYYYHDNVYYIADRDGDRTGYRVVDRPTVDAVTPPGPAPVVAAPPVLNGGPAPVYTQQAKTGQLFAYPRNNQTATEATFDRIECERWGTQQTGFQPAQSLDNAELKGNYQRAVAACLEGRGYSVR